MYEPPKCRKCGRLIEFVPTRKGAMMPIDSFSVFVLPYHRGSVYYTDRGELIRGYLVEPGTKGAVKAHAPHFATCPYAAENRKPRPDKRRENIREQVAREKAEARRRESLREEKARLAAERAEAEEAQYSIFG